MQKIFYVITKSNFGGAQKYVFDLARLLPKDAWNAEVLLGGDGELKKRLEKEHIPVRSLPALGRDISIGSDLKTFFALFRIFRKEKPHVVHLNSSKVGLIGGLAARLAGVPRIIFTAHGWVWNENRSRASKVFFASLHWFTVFFSHKTVTVSHYMENQGKKLVFLSKKIVMIHNGIGAPEFFFRDEARALLLEKIHETKRDAFSANHSWIGTISELHKNKGLEYLIEAIAELPAGQTYSLVVIGEGEERAHLQQLAKSKGILSSVAFVGHVFDAPRYLKAFDVFTLTSTTEALGYVLLEAGSAELPVIATAVGGIPEIIESQKTGITIRPKSSKEIVMALHFLEQNPEKKVSFAESLKEKTETEFSLEKMVSKTVELY